MKNIVTILCILALAPAAFAGGTMLFTTPNNSYNGTNNWYQGPRSASNYYTASGNSFYTENNYTQNAGYRNYDNSNVRTVTQETTYERRIKGGYDSTYRTKQDKYYNHGGVKFGSGFTNNGMSNSW